MMSAAKDAAGWTWGQFPYPLVKRRDGAIPLDDLVVPFE